MVFNDYDLVCDQFVGLLLRRINPKLDPFLHLVGNLDVIHLLGLIVHSLAFETET